MDNIVKLFETERISIYEFSKKYKVEQKYIIDKLKENGFLYAKSKISTNLIINLKYAAKEYLEDDTIQAQEICKKYNISHSTFSKYMKDYIKVPIKARPKSNFNERYFDIIDTEEKAYILGYYWADGYISSSPMDQTKDKNVYTIEMSLQGQDIEILKFIKKEFNTPRPILVEDITTPTGKPTTRCRLIVNSKHMWNILNKYGCTPRKSLTEKFPDEQIFKSKDLIRHFIRGYFDGDGCITYVNKEHTRPGVQILGTEEFLSKMLTYFPSNCQNLSLYHNHMNEKEVIRYIHTSDNKAKDIMKYLYDNSTIYLFRKFRKYVALCYGNIASESSKIGESCDANPEVNNSIAKGELLLQSVEGE